MAELLNVDKVWAGYGDAVVLEDISFSLEAGGSLALLGRNGMGKTSPNSHRTSACAVASCAPSRSTSCGTS